MKANRKISAKEIVLDIRSQMAASMLIEKYRLSQEQLNLILTKLVQSGALSELEANAWRSIQELSESRQPRVPPNSSPDQAKVAEESRSDIPNPALSTGAVRFMNVYAALMTILSSLLIVVVALITLANWPRSENEFQHNHYWFIVSFLLFFCVLALALQYAKLKTNSRRSLVNIGILGVFVLITIALGTHFLGFRANTAYLIALIGSGFFALPALLIGAVAWESLPDRSSVRLAGSGSTKAGRVILGAMITGVGSWLVVSISLGVFKRSIVDGMDPHYGKLYFSAVGVVLLLLVWRLAIRVVLKKISDSSQSTQTSKNTT